MRNLACNEIPKPAGCFSENRATLHLHGGITTTLVQNFLPRGATFYYRIQAFNGSGTSAWVNATPFPVITP